MCYASKPVTSKMRETHVFLQCNTIALCDPVLVEIGSYAWVFAVVLGAIYVERLIENYWW